jgi:hypothetical protein
MSEPDGPHHPTRTDPVARAASVIIGGPAGRRLASAIGFWRALPVLVLLGSATFALGIVQKQHCRALGWTSPDQFWHACYSDIPVLYGSASLGAADRPGLVRSLGAGGLGQSPLAGALMWITSAFVPADGTQAPRQFFDFSAVLLTMLLALAIGAVVLTLANRGWDAAHLALSPVLITAGLISYEVLAVALVAVAMLALARGRVLLGGALVGLAVTAAPQVALVVLAVAVLARRFLPDGGGLGFTAAAIGTVALVRVVLLAGLTGGVGSAWTSWRQSQPGYGSLWLIPQLLRDSEPDPALSWGGRLLQGLFGWIFGIGPLGGTSSSVLAALLLAVLAGLVLRATVGGDLPPWSTFEDDDLPFPGDDPVGSEPAGTKDAEGRTTALRRSDPGAEPGFRGRFVRARVAPLALALLAATLLSVKALPVQASLLLLPLIALSGLRWRDHLIWATTELVYFVGIWLYIAGDTTPSRGLPDSFYLVLLVARLAGIAWVGWQGVQAYRARSRPGEWEPAGQAQISSPPPGDGRLLDGRDDPTPHHSG